MDAEIATVLRIAREASDRVSEIYATPFEVEMKGPGDPVTRADREANALICDALSRAFPGDAILAEESVPESEAEIARLVAHDRVWYVDPLDGTREFADRNGEFAVMIGLAVKGRAELGVLVMPVSGDALAGRVGGGAFIEHRDGTRAPLAVSAVADPRDATLVVSRSHRPAIVDPVVKALGMTRLVPCGSVGVKVSRIVLGAADVYLHGGRGAKRWDTCAPEAVLVAAGGRFGDLDGAAIDYGCVDLHVRRGIVATNGALWEAVVGVTREVGTPRV
jgi:3'(2'), 5'-bisphosphate nucleotidase